MANESLNTGVNGLEAADQNQDFGVMDVFDEDYSDQDVAESEDVTMSEYEVADEPEDLSLEEFLSDYAEENGANEGVADLPKQEDDMDDDQQADEEEEETQDEETDDQQEGTQQQEEQTEPFMTFKSQDELNSFMSNRINTVKRKEREKIEAEYAATFGVPVDQLAEQAVEKRARELMEEFPEEIKSLKYAKVLARTQMPQQQQTQQAPKQEQESFEQPKTNTQTGGFDKQAFQESLRAGEEAVRAITGDDNFSIKALYDSNPFFKAALSANPFKPLQAYKEAMQAQQAQKATIKAEKAKAQSEVVNGMRKNASRAMKNTSKGTGKSKPTWENMTRAQRDAYSEKLQSQG